MLEAVEILDAWGGKHHAGRLCGIDSLQVDGHRVLLVDGHIGQREMYASLLIFGGSGTQHR